jgi:hypothetical protein
LSWLFAGRHSGVPFTLCFYTQGSMSELCITPERQYVFSFFQRCPKSTWPILDTRAILGFQPVLTFWNKSRPNLAYSERSPFRGANRPGTTCRPCPVRALSYARVILDMSVPGRFWTCTNFFVDTQKILDLFLNMS